MKHARSSNMKAIVLFLFVVLMLAIAGCHDTHEDSVYASGSGRGDEEIQTPTGPMVLIPAGEFTMGTTSEQEQWLRDKGWWHNWMTNEQPSATVYLDAYYIDKYEVTNAQYGEFMKATGRSAPLYWNDSKYNQPNQPVVGVTYDDAEAYSEWAGKRLPTEAEWEKAARGTDGRHFPWGNEAPTCEYAVWDDGDNSGCGMHRPWPVGSKPAGVSPYGIHDMAGNAWEWVNSWFNEARGLRVIRGGSWYKDIPGHLRTAARLRSPAHSSNEGGWFRCARSQ